MARQVGQAHRALNTARGPIVRTTDLLDALDAGTVWRAGLDVLEFEGRSLESLSEMADPEARAAFERLLADRRVLLTPHVAGWTEESLVKLSSVLADKILGHEKAPADGQGFLNEVEVESVLRASSAVAAGRRVQHLEGRRLPKLLLHGGHHPILVSLSTLRDTHILLCSASANVVRSLAIQS